MFVFITTVNLYMFVGVRNFGVGGRIMFEFAFQLRVLLLLTLFKS